MYTGLCGDSEQWLSVRNNYKHKLAVTNLKHSDVNVTGKDETVEDGGGGVFERKLVEVCLNAL